MQAQIVTCWCHSGRRTTLVLEAADIYDQHAAPCGNALLPRVRAMNVQLRCLRGCIRMLPYLLRNSTDMSCARSQHIHVQHSAVFMPACAMLVMPF